MKNETIGEMMVFGKHDQILLDTQTVVFEVSEVEGDIVELGYDSPFNGHERAYIKLNLPDLLTKVLKHKQGD